MTDNGFRDLHEQANLQGFFSSCASAAPARWTITTP